MKERLEGDDAILLWLEGKDAWNAFMAKNPNCYVSFSDVVFSTDNLKSRFPDNEMLKDLIDSYDKHEEIKFDFDDYEFYIVSFLRAEFFGAASFARAQFNGAVRFEKTMFHKSVSFRESEFKSNVSFFRAAFYREPHFFKVKFKKNSFFLGTEFHNGVNFVSTDFDTELNFLPTTLKDEIYFKSCNFKAKFLFKISSLHSKKIKSLDFTGSAFDGVFILEGECGCIPDLRRTKLTHHFDFSSTKIKLKRKFIKNIGLQIASDSLDSARLCRLKELAEQSKNHKLVLELNAEENRADRWNNLGVSQSVIDCLYSSFSSYGQSVFKPLISLIITVLLFAQLTLNQSNIHKEANWQDALTVSIATVTPFFSISKSARDRGLENLFGHRNNLPDNYDLYSYSHSSISFIFIFLIGLGLRNRFKI